MPAPRVLVIEADARGQGLLGFQLSRLGCEVISADTGEHGLELALADPPDLVLVDVVAGADSQRVVRALRADRRTTRCRIVVASPGGEPDPGGAGGAGGDAQLAKPFTRRDIIRMLASLDSTPATPAGSAS